VRSSEAHSWLILPPLRPVRGRSRPTGGGARWAGNAPAAGPSCVPVTNQAGRQPSSPVARRCPARWRADRGIAADDCPASTPANGVARAREVADGCRRGTVRPWVRLAGGVVGRWCPSRDVLEECLPRPVRWPLRTRDRGTTLAPARLGRRRWGDCRFRVRRDAGERHAARPVRGLGQSRGPGGDVLPTSSWEISFSSGPGDRDRLGVVTWR